MIRDLATTLQLRGRLLLTGSRTWLSFLGIDADDRSLVNQLYGVYVAIFMAGWFVLMGSWLLNTAAILGALLGRDVRAAVLGALPAVLVGTLVVALVAALRSSPIKLTAPDMAYVAGSPLSRRAIVLAGFLEALPLVCIVGCTILGLLGVILGSPTEPGGVQAAGTRAVLLALPFFVFGLGATWLLGVARLSLPHNRRVWLWFVPVAVALVAAVVPTIGLWPGRAVTSAVRSSANTGGGWILAALALLAIAAMLWLAERVSMTDVVDESQFYAQLRAVGMYVFTDLELARRMLQQSTASRRVRRPAGSLPRFAGRAAPLSRALLNGIRRPLTLVLALVWGGSLLYGGAWVLTAQPAIQQAMTWFALVLLIPPTGLGAVYRADASNPFLRQLLPIDSLLLLAADALPALVALFIGAFISWALGVLPLPQPLVGAALLPLLGMNVLLSQGLSVTPLPGRRGRIPYAVVAAICLGAVLLINRYTGSPVLTLGSAALIALVQGQIMLTAR